jgi:hypothetical protein
MTIKFTIDFPRTDLVVGEDLMITLSVNNASGQAVTISDPVVSNEWPQFRVKDLKDNTEKTYRVLDMAKGQHGFVTPLPDRKTTIEPSQTLNTTTLLLSRVRIPSAGKYEITAILQANASQVSSNSVTVTVHPLRVESLILMGQHSGTGPVRNILYSSRYSDRTALLAGSLTADAHGELQIMPALRLTDEASPLFPTASVTKNQLVWPAQWFVWMTGDQLKAMYLMQWKTAVSPGRHEFGGGTADLIGPALLDLENAKGLEPAPAIVALWEPGKEKARLAIGTLTEAASLKIGPSIDMETGKLAWSRATYLSNGLRLYALAIERGGETHLEIVTGMAGDASLRRMQIARWEGVCIGSGTSLDKADALSGATITRNEQKKGEVAYTLHAWHCDSKGMPGPVRSIPIEGHHSRQLVQAFVDVNSAGDAVALLKADDGQWYSCNAEGRTVAVPDAIVRAGEPIGIFWSSGGTAMIPVADSIRGIAYHALPGMEKK